jgi:hypothetical protein
MAECVDYTPLRTRIIGRQYRSKAMITRRRFCRSAAAAAIIFSKATLAAAACWILAAASTRVWMSRFAVDILWR